MVTKVRCTMDNNNKYIFDIETISKKESEANKELRRKKHRQGRVIAWVVLVAGILLLGTALFFGGRALVKGIIGRGGKTVASVDGPDDGGGENSVIDELIGGEDEVVVTPPEPVEVGPSEEELFEEALRNYIHTMTPEEQVLGLFIVSPEQITGVSAAIKAGDGTKKALEEYPVGGIIYSDKNMIDPDQFKTMIEGTKGYSKYPLFIAVDETLGKSVFPAKMKVAATQSASEIAAGGDASVARAEESKIAGYLSEFGINLNLGVDADVYPAPSGEDDAVPAVSFGTDANVVAEMVTQCIGALNEQGISAGVKFFPGQGYASADTSEAIAQNERTREEMEACELLPFISAADAGASAFVVSHESVPGLAGEAVYASQSKEVMTNLIRVELEMDGIIIITDDLSKTAVSAYYESGEYCVAALKAGADMLLKPEDFKAAYAEVLNAVNTGVIAKERVEDSLVRIYKVKFKGMTFDELNSLTAEKIVQP